MIDTPAARAVDRAELAALMQGVPVQIVPGFAEVRPRPARLATIDPATRLKRQPAPKPKALKVEPPVFAAVPLTAEERQMLRDMAGSL